MILDKNSEEATEELSCVPKDTKLILSLKNVQYEWWMERGEDSQK